VTEGKVTGDEMELCKVELHNLHSSPNIIRINKPRGMRWSGHAAHMVAVRNVNRIQVQKM
jgi:hypothetical protein